jgi:hypothetical protein
VTGEEAVESPDLERLCQGISPGAVACTYPATVHCTSCKKWFCDAHAEDERWHLCVLPSGDEGWRGVGAIDFQSEQCHRHVRCGNSLESH